VKTEILDWMQALRIKHWVKNIFVFAALIFSLNLFNPIMFFKVCIGFLLYSLAASGVYMINDILDSEEDRQHPYKCKKAIPSGRIDIRVAKLVAFLLSAGSISASLAVNFWFAVCVILYVVINLVYSKWLKHVVILDAFCIASGFVLRVIAGAVIIQVEISRWFIICTGLLSLFLAFGKRRHELILLGENANKHRKILTEYSPYFLDQMAGVLTSSTLIAYILYTISPRTVEKFGTDKLMLTVPFVLYGIFRYLYLVHQKGRGGNPARLLLTDNIPLSTREANTFVGTSSI